MNFLKVIILASIGIIAFTTPLPGCRGEPNTNPLIQGQPIRVQSTPNGVKYQISYDGRFMYMLNLTGTAYEMGLATGTLMQKELKSLFKKFYSWLDDYFATNITLIARLPKFMRRSIAQFGVSVGRVMLRLTYKITKPYTPSRFMQEIQGLSDGSGINKWRFIEVNMVAELTKASCSVFGAWGAATQTSNVIHMRTLDWDAHAPMSEWPAVMIYHSNQPGSNPFANIAWPGFIGTLTGMSSKIGIGEKAGDEPHSNETRIGKPWNYVLRDVLQFSSTYQQAIYAMQAARRTCSIYLGLGDREQNTFRILEYSKPHVFVYDDKNWHFDDNHPQIPGVIWEEYESSKNKGCFKNLVNAQYGQIDIQFLYQYLAPSGLTGDSQVAAMDYLNYQVILAYPNPVTKEPGYSRPGVKIDLKPFFFGNHQN